MVGWLAIVGTTEEYYDVGTLSNGYGTGNHVGRSYLVDSAGGLTHIERTLCLDSRNLQIIRIREVEVLIVAYIFVRARELDIQVVFAFKQCLCCGIESSSNSCPRCPTTSVLVVDSEERFIVLVVQYKTDLTDTTALGTARHLELRATQRAKLYILIFKDISRSGILQITGTLIVLADTIFRHNSLGERNSRQCCRHQLGCQFKVQLLFECLKRRSGIGGRTAVVAQHDGVGIWTDEGNLLVNAQW